jgi:ATP-dependent exoDNAse (exonuclease V) alpha subunit
MGTYETHVYIRNEKTGDITFTRYSSIEGLSLKEKTETWVNPDKVIEKGKEVWVIDETSMMGSKEVNELLKAAKEAEARVIFVGDTKQLASVEAGQIFKDMQANGLNTVVMTEKVRQKEEEYKKAVDALGKQDWENFKQKVDAKVKEIVDRKERLQAIKQDFLSGDPQKTLIVTARNADKNELNAQIREALKAQEKLKDGYVFTVRESKNLLVEEKRYAFSYAIGDTVFATRDDLKAMGIKSKSNEFTVVSVDYLKNTITIQNSNGKKFTINTKEWGDKFSVFRTKTIELSKGDRVITLKNDKALNIKNGEMWQVVKVDKSGNITIKNESKTKTFNIFKDYNYIDHGYAVTVHKSQGMTVNKVVYDVSSTRTNFNEVYTAVTRGKVEYSIYTDNKEVFYDRMKHEQFKTSTIELSKTSTEKSKTSPSVAKTAEQSKSTKSTNENELETSASYSRSR